MVRKKNKEYYAVVSGRVDEPTIFSSWGDAHPRVTGCLAKHKAFFTLKEAREYMESQRVPGYKEVIKATAQGTTPERNSVAYYAVANGANSGIREVCGKTGALKEIREISGSCHKRFMTRVQAEAFIEDWKESFADAWRRELRRGLDQGLRPRDMKLDIEGGILHGKSEDDVAKELTDELDRKLELDGEEDTSDPFGSSS